MEIKKADSKGRVTVGQDGQVYSVKRHEDGSLTLFPVKIPNPPRIENGSFQAIYWDPAEGAGIPDRLYIHTYLDSRRLEKCQWVAALANELELPVVVEVGGTSGAIADYLDTITECDVIHVQPRALVGG